ncbi:protein translocase subunit SecD [Wohlfahrtiimonas larvae]|uniref:Multifunctional fusion protein n=1 Tax=Wohlfahrtiimonas larvae TaxID=1157986 RepID=A0ABP9MRV3_9GAMM|nr:protein translocase subunit SecD [Wohlfahrtiimonas larvae]
MLNRYPLWKNLLIILVLAISTLLALPNLYGEDPSVQISATRTTKVDDKLVSNLEALLAKKEIPYKRIEKTDDQILVRFNDTETQLKAKDLIASDLGNGYMTALNLAPDMPEWLESFGFRPMYLGLDLRGGVHFLLEIDMKTLITQLTESYADEIKTSLGDQKLTYKSVTVHDSSIDIVFNTDVEAANARNAVTINKQNLMQLNWSVDGNKLIAKLSDAELTERKRNVVAQNIVTLRNRVNELGVAEPIIQQQGADRIVVQLPGVQDTTQAKEILGTTATLEFHIVYENSALEAPQVANGSKNAPLGTKLYHWRDTGVPILLKRQVMLTGESIVNATAQIDPENRRPLVSITLDSQGADKFSVVTKANVGKPMATVFIEHKVETKMVNGEEVKRNYVVEEVANAATIQQQLFKNFVITGLDSLEEANKLAITLRSGALAAPIQIIEERTIGPSAGKDNIDKGMTAGFYGLAAVMVFMLIRYSMFGLIANVALVANLILIIACLSLLQATLTLPGIAGIVLSLGMSVDANVLINERIREVLRKGVSPQNAINDGFGKAFATIMDANLTSLFAAVVLFLIGSGAIKGFAVTLSIGIITSMFTAVLMNRAIVNAIWGGRRIKSLPVGGKELFHIFSGETTYDFMKYAKAWLVFCILVIVVAIGSVGIFGFKYGLDFTGGTEVEAVYKNSIETDDIRNALLQVGLENAEVQHFGSSRDVLITLPIIEGMNESSISTSVLGALEIVDQDVTIKRIDFIGSKVGDELVTSGIMASVIAILMILAYIWIRFEWKLATSTILSTVHDAAFVLAVFAILGHYGQLQFDLTSLAAVLAVIGYSVNDTVVVLDRIRENFRAARSGTPKEIIDQAINQTLSRTIMTSVTTLLAVLALYLFGGEAIHSFSFIMLIGIIVGTYSSIFIASASALILGIKREDLLPPKKEKAEEIQEESMTYF